MNGQADRCDRTAYVSGLQPTISDIELFEVFNRVAHVEKVIVRNGAVRHALVVFKTVQGLYQVLVSFQGTTLHGRQLHIRPLRESSHANSETLTTMFEKAKSGGGGGAQQQKRPSSVNESSGVAVQTQNPPPQYSSSSSSYRNHNQQNYYQYQNQQRGYRNSSGSSPGSSYNAGRRPTRYNRNMFPNESYPTGIMSLFQHAAPQFSGYNQSHPYRPYNENNNEHHLRFEDYTEGAKRFDGLANLIRSSTPTDPFAAYHKSSENDVGVIQRPRANSTKEHRYTPPTWKMELQIKKEGEDPVSPGGASESEDPASPKIMTPQEFLAQIVRQTAAVAEKTSAENREQKKKNRPNLSVINPSLFYEQYPRTSSPVVTFAPNSTPNDKNSSPHDPAVLAYSRLRVPQSAFDGLSPIDTNNCSFITKHLGNTSDEAGNSSGNLPQRRDYTNDELSDMIVSTGNLRINPATGTVDSFMEIPSLQPIQPLTIAEVEPAPWSPRNRLRAESGCNITSQQIASPQFSPIKPKSPLEQLEQFAMDSEEDEVFGSVNKHQTSADEPEKVVTKEKTEQKMSDYEDINNSRLPSNSHSAAPSSDQKSFAFPPEYPMCRHSSVPSIAHLVGDLSDFCPLSPHIVTSKLLDEVNVTPALQDGEEVDKTSEDKTAENIQNTSNQKVLEF